MRTKVFLGLMAVASVALLPGCVSTIDGRTQPGVSLSKSTVENNYDVKPPVLYQAARDVLKSMGTITTDDTIRSVLEAKVESCTVWVRVEEVDNKVSKLIVQARSKSGSGDADLASYIDKQIVVRLASGSVPTAAPARRAN